MKKKKIDWFFYAWLLFYACLIIFGIYLTYIEMSNTFMFHDFLKNEVRK